ncbi:hypothetical protein M5C99_13150 [Acidovorax sp. NCPPB 2350]|nr:hypothetical protein M5C99_13150 [Acidovorax sp. NCPPB 2350]
MPNTPSAATAPPATAHAESTESAAAKPSKSRRAETAAPAPAKSSGQGSRSKRSKPATTATPKRAKAIAPPDSKPRKPKLVRDSFTIPKDEYAAIDELKQRLAERGTPAKKSELLRAGLKLLSSLTDAALEKAMQAVPSIKTGRPKATPESSEAHIPAAKSTKARK